MNNKENLIEILTEADGCFEAALIDGWFEALAEGNVGSIRDIWVRRISYARDEIVKALSLLQSQPTSGRWIPFTEHWPSLSPALDNPDVKAMDTVLVTNNIDARNRMGRMSHVWWATPIKSSNGGVVAFDEGGRKIEGLTHWLDPLADPQPLLPEDALLSFKKVGEHYDWFTDETTGWSVIKTEVLKKELQPQPKGEVSVTTSATTGQVVAVTRQNQEGQILSVIWEAQSQPEPNGCIVPSAWVEALRTADGGTGLELVEQLQMGSVTATPVQSQESPEDRFEQFIQAAIDNAPEPVRKLGEYLADVLEEDQWLAAERLLNRLALQSQEAAMSKAYPPAHWDTYALEKAREIWLHPAGMSKSQWVAKIQCTLLDAMRWARPHLPFRVQMPEGWREELETIAELLDADGDEWNCAVCIRHLLSEAPPKVQAPLTIDHPLIQFLLGEGEYEGKWFGDSVERAGYQAKYWWRSHLRALLTIQKTANGVSTNGKENKNP